MKLTAHFSRRIIAGVGLASAAILLPTAALATSASSAFSAFSASSAAAGTPAQPATFCTSSAIRLWYAEPGDGTAGSSYFQIELSNLGHTTCTLYGYPGVSALSFRGHEVGLPASHGGGRFLATLSPGGTAHFVLRVVDAGAVCLHPLNAVVLRVYPPGQFAAQLVGLPSQGCRGRSVLSVDSVHLGTGIPGYTIR